MTADEVREVMKKYVKDDAMTIVVVAPAEQVKEQLEQLGRGRSRADAGEARRAAAAAGATTKPADKELLKKAA